MNSDFSLDDLFPIPLRHSCFSFASSKQEHHHHLAKYHYGMEDCNSRSMIGENRQLVTDEPVEFEK